MMKTLGRADTNNIRFNKPDISSNHARITNLENGNFLVEDLDSTNGTFVNGYRIKKATISLNDEVRLSESTIINLTEVFGLSKQKSEPQKIDPKDFTNEFNLLKQVWDSYQKERISITKKHQSKSTFIRAAITLAPLVIWEILQFTFDENSKAGGIVKSNYIVFSVMGSTIAMLSTGNMSPVEKLSQLDEEFRVKYVCPNPTCRTQLGNVPWLSYSNQGKCFRCGAKYNKV